MFRIKKKLIYDNNNFFQYFYQYYSIALTFFYKIKFDLQLYDFFVEKCSLIAINKEN